MRIGMNSQNQAIRAIPEATERGTWTMRSSRTKLIARHILTITCFGSRKAITHEVAACKPGHLDAHIVVCHHPLSCTAMLAGSWWAQSVF